MNSTSSRDKKVIAARKNSREKEFWLRQLSGGPLLRHVPFRDFRDFRDSRGTGVCQQQTQANRTPKQYRFQWGDPLYSALLQQAKHADPRLHMLLMAGVVLLLYQHAAGKGEEKNILLTTPIYKPPVEGEFINTVLPLRNPVDGSLTVRQVLNRMGKTFIEAVNHQDFPMELLSDQLPVPLSLAAAVILENIQDKNHIRPVAPQWVLSFTRNERALEGRVEYDPSVYAERDLERIIRHLRHVLEEMAASPDRQVSSLAPLPPGEQRRISTAAYPPAAQETNKSFRAPGNKIEEALAEIWADLLEKDKNSISTTDRFFQLDGHSLKAIMLSARIHKAFNVSIPLPVIFKLATISALAGYLRQAGETRYHPVKPVEKQEYYPLAPAQQRLYILKQLEPESTHYNVPQLFQPAKELTRERLEKAFSCLIGRHESLRTSFILVEDVPMQRIHKEAEFRVEEFDPVTAVRSFDLSRAPLLRAAWLKGSDNKGNPDSLLLVDMHHIISDATTRKIFRQELAALLEDRDLPALRLQYRDYSQWLNLAAQREAVQHQEEYWLKQFQGEIPVPNLPTDLPRPALQRFEGDTVTLSLPPKETAALQQIARQHGATMFMALLAVFYLFLAKISGQEDIVVGTPVLGRRHTDLEGIPGIFVNTLALRNFPVGEKTFAAFLEEVKQRTLEAFENQEYPFEELVDRLLVNRDLSRNPLFDAVLTFGDPGTQHKNSREAALLKKIHHHRYEYRVSKFDLTLAGEEEEGRAALHFTYAEKLFTKKTITRWLNYVREIIIAVSDNPGIRIAAIRLIHGEEKRKLLGQFNRTAVGYPLDQTIHDRFARQAERTPQRIALVGPKLPISNSKMPINSKLQNTNYKPGDEVRLSYRELHEQSNGLAYLLKERGVVPDTIVAIMVERSVAMVVGLLGILKAGGAYMPIDPAYPQERLDFMLKDSSAKLLLNDHDLSSWLFTAGHSFNFPASPSSSLAYLLFTSGSTGKPKGAAIEHGSVVNILAALQQRYPLTENDGYLLKTSYLFDVSVTELFGFFQQGGRLAILEADGEKDPCFILERVERWAVTHLNFVPSMFTLFLGILNQENTGKLSRVKYIFLAGEALHPAGVKKFHHLGTGVRLENLYGPTEAAVYATGYSLQDWNNESCVPIGKPLSNIRIYIRDRYGHPQGIGIPGELTIAGAGLARGYLNRPELTAEKFCLRRPGGALFKKTAPPGPPGKNFLRKRGFKLQGSGEQFSEPQDGPKGHNRQGVPPPLTLTNNTNTIYTTGDLARWLGDGNIQYLGRIDHQVKIRGFRVEPAEIQSHLVNLPGIKEAIVLSVSGAAAPAEPGQGEERALCAYLVPADPGTPIDIPATREYLAGRLPYYMIPGYFIQLERIPFTPGGKPDRHALPAPIYRQGVSHAYRMPRNRIEKKLVEIWARLLFDKVTPPPAIGIDDHFFEIGGHSLKATILLGKIHREFDVKLPLAEVFKNPTIQGLSAAIIKAAADRYIPIEPTPPQPGYVLSSAQRRMYVTQLLDENDTRYNMLRVMLLLGTPDRDKLDRIFRELIHRHESLRTSFEAADQEPLQKVHEPAQIPFNLETDDLPPGLSEDRFIRDFIRPFDLSKAPLFRVGLLQTAAQRYLLIIDMHHIITDGISLAILSGEFMALYRGETLTPLRLHYKDFSHWQNRFFGSGEIKKQEEYWLTQLAGELPVLRLPTDFPRTPAPPGGGYLVVFALSQALTAAVKKLMAETHSTLYMVFLTLCTILLSKYSGQEDIVVGSGVSGRRHPDLENIIGIFVNLLAMRNRPQKDKPFIAFLNEVRENVLEAFANQDYPFEELVRKLNLQRELSRNPLFDAAVQIRNIEIPELEIPGLTVKPYESPGSRVRFDLLITGSEKNGVIRVSVTYSTALFKKTFGEKLQKHLLEIVEQVVADPGIRLKDLKLSTTLASVPPVISKQDNLFRF